MQAVMVSLGDSIANFTAKCTLSFSILVKCPFLQ